MAKHAARNKNHGIRYVAAAIGIAGAIVGSAGIANADGTAGSPIVRTTDRGVVNAQGGPSAGAPQVIKPIIVNDGKLLVVKMPAHHCSKSDTKSPNVAAGKKWKCA